MFSVAVILITEDYEHVIASEILQGQAEDYALRKANNLSVELPQTQRLSGYDAKDPNVPEALAGRPPAKTKWANLHVPSTTTKRDCPMPIHAKKPFLPKPAMNFARRSPSSKGLST